MGFFLLFYRPSSAASRHNRMTETDLQEQGYFRAITKLVSLLDNGSTIKHQVIKFVFLFDICNNIKHQIRLYSRLTIVMLQRIMEAFFHSLTMLYVQTMLAGQLQNLILLIRLFQNGRRKCSFKFIRLNGKYQEAKKYLYVE